MSEIIYKHIVNETCIDKLTQQQSVMHTAFENAAEATYHYIEQCGKFMSDNCNHTYHDADEHGYMTDTYEDKDFTYIIELVLEEGE